MVQAELKKAEKKVCVDPNLIVLDKLTVPVDIKVRAEQKHYNKELLKLIQKTKYNAKIHEDLIPIERIRSQRYYRNYRVY